jgi:hypothetical protein
MSRAQSRGSLRTKMASILRWEGRVEAAVTEMGWAVSL